VNYLTKIVLILFIGIQSCSKPDNSFLLNELLNKEVDTKKVQIIFIFSDYDCITCFYEYSDYSDVNKNTIGLFDSEQPNEFLIKLNKINSNINWKPIKNRNIINLIYKIEKAYKGPYVLEYKNGGFVFTELNNLHQL